MKGKRRAAVFEHLLVGECKWTSGESSDSLLAELRAKAEKLPFAQGRMLVTKLFLKHPPEGTMKDVLLPADVIAGLYP